MAHDGLHRTSFEHRLFNMKPRTLKWFLPLGWTNLDLEIEIPDEQNAIESINTAIEAMRITRSHICKRRAARDAFVPALPLL